MNKKENVHYLFSELAQMYLRGTLKAPDTPGMWVIFYPSEEHKKKGEKYLTYAPWEEFEEMIKLDQKYKKDFQNHILRKK